MQCLPLPELLFIELSLRGAKRQSNPPALARKYDYICADDQKCINIAAAFGFRRIICPETGTCKTENSETMESVIRFC
jgi:hypothetical protein